MHRLSLQPVLLEPPIDLFLLHMPQGQPTRIPGTPVGELLARRPSQTTLPEPRPKPSKRPSLPIDMLCSDSNSDATSVEMAPSPATSPQEPDDKPKPSAAPHLRLSAAMPQPSEESLSLSRTDFGYQIDFDFCRHTAQDFASSPSSSKPGVQPPTRACAKLLVRSGLRRYCCFCLKSECLCRETQPQPRPASLYCKQFCPQVTLHPPGWGRPHALESGEPILRFHDSDSEASSPSVASAGFAQVWGNDFRFFPSEDEASPAASSESLSSSLSRPGLRYRHPQPWVPIDIRPRYMYSAGLLAIVASASAEARLPMIFQSLEGILFGSQACAWTLLCLDHHEWLQVVLCNKACHDYVHEQASASSIRLPSDLQQLNIG